MSDTPPDTLATTRLALRLAEPAGGCSICGAEPGHAAQFHLLALQADGVAIDTGNRICGSCACYHGYTNAARMAIKAQGLHLDADTMEADFIAAIQAEHQHLHSLLDAGQLTAPPPIEREHFLTGAA